MKRINYLEVLIWTITAVMIIMACFVYITAPKDALIPLHWNTHGQVDSYGSAGQIFILPLICIALNLMLKLLPRIDPKKENYLRFKKTYDTTRVILAVFMLGVMCMTVYTAFYPEKLSTSRFIIFGTGILFCVLGNLMPKFKHNYFVGFKTPWTLADGWVWGKTHRLAGALWFWSGLAVAILSIFVQESIISSAMAIIFGTAVAVPFIYSYLIFKGHKNKSNKTD